MSKSIISISHKHKRLGTAVLSAAMLASAFANTAFAANESTAVIDTAKKPSLTLYKYDMTSAEKDKAWTTSSYVSTGLYDETVNKKLENYAIQGVEFTYLKVADLSIYKGNDADGNPLIMPVYGFDESTSAGVSKATEFLDSLGLKKTDAYRNENNIYYYTSDTMIDALSASLTANSTVTKTALEAYIKKYKGTAMPETSAKGKSEAKNLDQGLYLLVETRVPEDVVDTTNPFLVSLPMTTVDGTAWNYDVTVYPKNFTGKPDLKKQVRETKNDTGNNEGSATDITDGYAHHATASAGDVVDYQIISTLPTITSPATSLTTYSFVDTLSKGIRYNHTLPNAANKNVTIEFFKDKACTDKVATWTENDGKFTASFSEYKAATGSKMTIDMTAKGLSEINTATTVYKTSTSTLRGYSNLTMRITYSCTVNSDASTVIGDSGNPNEVVLTWKRTNTNYYDTLNDDCHVYVYGLDLTKEFSDNAGNFAKVKFLIHNTTDGYYVKAALDSATGVYYVTGHTAKENEATSFSPMSGDKNKGKVVVKGLEDDTYVITETQTDKGYTLLKENITVVIKKKTSTELCDICGKHFLTASATVNGKSAQMLENNGSVNALVPLKVVNSRGFELPKTGGHGTWMFASCGLMVAACGLALAIWARRRVAE